MRLVEMGDVVDFRAKKQEVGLKSNQNLAKVLRELDRESREDLDNLSYAIARIKDNARKEITLFSFKGVPFDELIMWVVLDFKEYDEHDIPKAKELASKSQLLIRALVDCKKEIHRYLDKWKTIRREKLGQSSIGERYLAGEETAVSLEISLNSDITALTRNMDRFDNKFRAGAT